MKRIFVLLTILSLSWLNSLYAQANETVAIHKKLMIAANGDTLYKALLLPQASSDNTYVWEVANDFASGDGIGATIYFDNKGDIVKLVYKENTEYTNLHYIAYYDDSGELYYLVFRNIQTNELSLNERRIFGVLHFDDIDIISQDIRVFETNGDASISDTKRISGNGNSFINSIEHMHLSNIGNTIALTDFFDVGSLGIKKLPIVTFISPNEMNSTIINANSVNLRELPYVSSPVITQLNAAEEVVIAAIERIDNIADYGNNYWYKVKIDSKTGYIFGAFLEPVEQIITE